MDNVGTIISLRDMIHGSMISSFQDILEYSIIFLGMVIAMLGEDSHPHKE